MKPTVSICIPSYNQEQTVGQAIESVLGQTFGDFELIIVDDHSSDLTFDVAAGYRDPRIRLSANERNLGAVANWNRTLDQARGRYIKLLCGDDFLYPACLQRQVQALEGHAGVVMASCRRDIAYQDGSIVIHGRGLAHLSGVVAGGAAIRRAVRSGTNIFGEPAAVLVRADVLAACGPFAARIPYVVDLEMWCRVLEHGDLFADRETLCAFRVGHASWSRRLARHQSAQVAMLFKELRGRQPQVVSPRDERLGELRSRALMTGRRLGYLVNAAKTVTHRTPAATPLAPGRPSPPS